MVQCKTFDIVGTSMLVVERITGPNSVPVGTTSATFTATVTNNGTASGSATVTFYEGVSGTIISIQGTSMINPGASQDISITINLVAWTIGSYQICAKTDQEA